MTSKRWLVTGLAFWAGLLTLLQGCALREKPPLEGYVPVESYVAVVPQVLRSGEKEAVSFSLFQGEKLVRSWVRVALAQNGREVAAAEGDVRGKGKIELSLPPLPPGSYELSITGNGFADKAPVRVEESLLLLVETDKPIYKPGQTVHIRAITLNSELKPVATEVTLEALDAKGIKVFRHPVLSDEYGLASADLPLSTEPNLGPWKITASRGEKSAQIDIRVEKYVLPKYQVKVELPREWYLVSEPLKGEVQAEYSFGKPVEGEVKISASRYVGQWEQYASFSGAVKAGTAQFELPPVKYVAGVPAARGMGNVMLEASVVEKATGYEEKASRLLTVASTPLSIQLIPESPLFKPSLPFQFLIVTETPDNRPQSAQVQLSITFIDQEQKQRREERQVATEKGKALLTVTPEPGSIALMLEARSGEAFASKVVPAGYSPSANFIHLEQTSPGIPRVGDKIEFQVYSTSEATNFYYEVVSRGKVAFTGHTQRPVLSLTTTPLMAPSSRLLIYQILPNSEVAADYLPFEVEASYPHQTQASFSQREVAPGAEVEVRLSTEGRARVGVGIVDRSVFILAENRLNLQQVFAELERLYMKPQVEVHSLSPFGPILAKGAKETFAEAGVVVLSNKTVPQGKQFGQDRQDRFFLADGRPVPFAPPQPEALVGRAGPAGPPRPADLADLAEVQRVRQFFPETWLWQEVLTDEQGRARLQLTAPDSITTWQLRAVALSPQKGLGVAEAQLRVFQPFFLTVDLPYSAIRGEEFPVRVALYNYLDQPQEVRVEIAPGEWFDLLDDPAKAVTLAPSDLGSAQFKIRPRSLGSQGVKLTARSRQAADAVVKPILIQPEGAEREEVRNFILKGGESRSLSTAFPPGIVPGSARASLAITASYLSQTIEGLEGLLQMPFGCGEQNMLLFAPDVFIAKYLKATGQLKPEVMAKAEMLMLTGYQRQLTYQRRDGSFSAFGQQDQEGSLWLTAFVLKTFSQARGLIYIDPAILDKARAWLTSHQQPDGSFEAVGFVHHQELIGGVKGKDALTAYVAIALLEAGERESAGRAISYLEQRLSGMESPYAVTITAYALELAGSPRRDEAYQRLMALAQAEGDSLFWDAPSLAEQDPTPGPRMFRPDRAPIQQSSQIEATGYATLALIKHGDPINGSRAARWLVSRRNAYGGFGSTQDTVVALQALTEYASVATANVALNITLRQGEKEIKQLRLDSQNYDVLHIVELPGDQEVTVAAQGQGDAVVQLVLRYNLPEGGAVGEEPLSIRVDYDTTQVEVNDTLRVSVALAFNPPTPVKAGMVVVDISVPTGFAPVGQSLDRLVGKDGLQRYEVAGRKVIFYIEDLAPGQKLAFSFDLKALHPVKAAPAVSRAYAYYQPELKGEAISPALTVSAPR